MDIEKQSSALINFCSFYNYYRDARKEVFTPLVHGPVISRCESCLYATWDLSEKESDAVTVTFQTYSASVNRTFPKAYTRIRRNTQRSLTLGFLINMIRKCYRSLVINKACRSQAQFCPVNHLIRCMLTLNKCHEVSRYAIARTTAF